MAEKEWVNHLGGETSPYLLQHIDNPVDWYPWTEIAWKKAQLENKPVLVSIGYSACHWCHVMAQESFADATTASLMNRWFINIKVDREERPDLDRLYQIIHQMLTGRSGGWPLTVFVNPHDRIPFFAGTYFPKESYHGLPSFKKTLTHIASLYQQQPQLIQQQNTKIQEVLANFTATTQYTETLDQQPLVNAVQTLLQEYDHFNGGFGNAPKFPQVHYLERFLQHAYQQQDTHVLYLVHHTLLKMAYGGIYDQIGGGFYRYAIDAHWHIPHFEKMLYDNGQLLSLYSDAYLITGDPCFRHILLHTGNWVLREMQASPGGYYATLDADTEHQEGRFYCWDKSEIKSLLTAAEYTLSQTYFNLASPANFEQRWHLHITHPLAELATLHNIPEIELQPLIDTAQHKLWQAREQRIRPHRDEKILTGWNGLMIQGLALAGLRLQQPVFIASAQRAVDFIRQHLWQEDRLYASYKDGQARFIAYLDDYAFLLNGLLHVLQAHWRTEDLLFAIELANALLAHYQDLSGGFFFTADDQENVLQRLKPYADEATPSGNGKAAWALNRLGYLLGETRYLSAAEQTLRAAWSLIQQAPAEYHSLLTVLADYLSPPEIIIITGQQPELSQWQGICQQHYAPQRMVFAIPNSATNLPSLLAQKVLKNGITAYICKGQLCSTVITDIDQLQAQLT